MKLLINNISSAEYFTTFSSGPEQIVEFSSDAGRITTAVVTNIVSSDGNPLIIRDPLTNAFTQARTYSLLRSCAFVN